MNGIEATRLIRELSGDDESQPAIIGMTNHFLTGDRNKCLAAGMDDYVLKPSSADAVAARLVDWMEVTHIRKAS